MWSKTLTLEPLDFHDFAHYGKREKDLEDLIASNLLDKLFEDYGLLPIFQERQYQAEADIYALNEQGTLVLFELKRSTGSSDAVLQALRYAQDAGLWTFSELQSKFETYTGTNQSLLTAHQEAFGLEHALHPRDLNTKQKLIIIGSAADTALVSAIDYWRRNRIDMDFLPYRLYELAGQVYFEFFALPYDVHSKPSETKGVLFDTNRTWDEEAIWYMIDNDRVAAFGDAQGFVDSLNPRDLVFLSHRYTGVVAAAKVKNGNSKKDGDDALYREVEFLTKKPKRNAGLSAMPFAEVSNTTGRSFFWARTIKVPYLDKTESELLLAELKKHLGSTS
jgi:hypothetical protein